MICLQPLQREEQQFLELKETAQESFKPKDRLRASTTQNL